jgi:hypothetical protein
MNKKLLPKEYICFLREYKALCRKYDLMVSSDGEPVSVSKADKHLWYIAKRTVEEICKREGA